MKSVSPLRYPGGKSALAGVLQEVVRINGRPRLFVEPFAGGAGAALLLLRLEYVDGIVINDRDPSIYDMWASLIEDNARFLELVRSCDLDLDTWRKQRQIYRYQGRVSRLRKGFSAFYLNRCNRSGIIATGGPIGGVEQAGEWKLDARFNREDLINRCERIGRLRDRIAVSNEDGIECIRRWADEDRFLFIDPPYYHKGQELYLNALDDAYHERLAAELYTMQDRSWMLTYDACEEIERLYKGWAKIYRFSLRYSAARRRQGAELMIVPKWMRVPTHHPMFDIDNASRAGFADGANRQPIHR